MRRILHIDMDAFFAAVEQKRNPDLAGRPVVVGGSGDPSQRGVVSTASYEAREYGVHSAMPLRTAHRLCPKAIFLPVDYAEYSRVSSAVKEVLRGFTPLIEDVGIDEAYLDISGIELEPEEIARRIKEAIKDRVGLTSSIGIAANKLLAKIASDMKKPDGLTIISGKDVERLIWPLPARKLPGIGPKTEAYLESIGIHTVGDIAAKSLDELTEHFGRSYGHYLYEISRGIDDRPIVTHWEPKSMSHEVTFQTDTDDWQTVARNLAKLVAEVVESMKADGYLCRTVTVKIRFNDFKTYTRARTIDGFTDSVDIVRRAAFEALGKIDLKKKVRLIGVRVTNLKKV